MLKDDGSDDDGADDGKHSESVPEQREELSYRALCCMPELCLGHPYRAARWRRQCQNLGRVWDVSFFAR